MCVLWFLLLPFALLMFAGGPTTSPEGRDPFDEKPLD